MYNLHPRIVPEVPTTLRLVVELVYDTGCPNTERARELLSRVLREVGVPAVWTEWCTDDPECPEALRRLGSPTILVNGKDVAPGPHPWALPHPGEGPRCRIYRDGDVLVGVPPSERVQAAISRAVGPDVV